MADGGRLIGITSQAIHEWDARDGRLISKRPAGESNVQHAAVSGDRRRAVTSGFLFDAENRDYVYQLTFWDLVGTQLIHAAMTMTR